MLTESPYLRATSNASTSHSWIGRSPPSDEIKVKEIVAHETRVISMLLKMPVILGLLMEALPPLPVFKSEFAPSFPSAARAAALVR